jgi:hypothetical protein
MTNEQINIAIAGACGWMYAPEDLRDYPWQDEQGEAFLRTLGKWEDEA